MIPLFLLLGRSQADPHGPLGVRFSGMAAGVPLFVSAGVFQRYQLEMSTVEHG